MLVRWKELGSKSERLRLRAMEEAARLFFAELAEGGASRAATALRKVDPRLSYELLGVGSEVIVSLRCDELPALPAARLVEALRPIEVQVQLGRCAGDHEGALALVAQHFGVSFEGTRIRVGVSRGHLLEIVLSVPLDVEGDPEHLQLAAELYLETHVGDETLDLWVGDISIDRIARRAGLLMVSDSRPQSETHPIASSRDLIERGVEGILAALPERLEGTALADQWTALSVPELNTGFQAGRLHASTRFPEAMKTALEGLPFSSNRFTRGGEVMFWICWSPTCRGSEERLALRTLIEEALKEHSQAARIVIAGTGFGRSDDFLDLWLPPEAALIRELLSLLLPIVGALEAGFYDTCWAEEIFALSVNDADNPWLLTVQHVGE